MTPVDKMARFEPDYAVPPGASLRSTVDALGMTQSDLASRADLSLKHVNQIIQGQAPITPETALALEKVTGVTARMWNSLESQYRERKVREEDQRSLAAETKWLKMLPAKTLIQRGYLPDERDKGRLLEEACKFFRVANIASWDRVWGQPLARFKKSATDGGEKVSIAAWLRIGEIEAEEIETADFDPQRFREVLKEVRDLTVDLADGFDETLVDLCASAGVALVFVPEISGIKTWGAARWLTPSRALIQLSLRYKKDDHLWFSFFHEAGHLLLHSKKKMYVSAEGDDEQELEANRFAERMLIPKDREKGLAGLTGATEIKVFAGDIGVAPGVVVGRLQKEGIISWSSSANQLKRTILFADS